MFVDLILQLRALLFQQLVRRWCSQADRPSVALSSVVLVFNPLEDCSKACFTSADQERADFVKQ